MRDTFPFWPPPNVQRPAIIAGRQSLFQLFDLPVNQAPRPVSVEIPLRTIPAPRTRPVELPVTPEAQSAGRTGPNLYDLFMLTEVMGRSAAMAAIAKVNGENA